MRTKPCIGCGYCCKVAVCGAGQLIYSLPAKGPCPVLIWDDLQHRWWCRMLLKDDIFHSTLGVNAGCGSSLNSYRRKIFFRKGRRVQSEIFQLYEKRRKP